MALCILCGGVAGLFFILPMCFTLPPLEAVLTAPYGQALPFIIYNVMGSALGAIIVMVMILLVTLLCSISITTAASRCTWAFSRDHALPFAAVWSRTTSDRPLYSLALVTVVEMLLGLIYLGNESAITAFASVGEIALSTGYLIPITLSLFFGRQQVSQARWTLGPALGTAANVVAVVWILFELVLFSMPTVLLTTAAPANYAPAVFVGLSALSGVWYAVSGKDSKSGRNTAVEGNLLTVLRIPRATREQHPERLNEVLRRDRTSGQGIGGLEDGSSPMLTARTCLLFHLILHTQDRKEDRGSHLQ
jgi:amino acid transporter